MSAPAPTAHARPLPSRAELVIAAFAVGKALAVLGLAVFGVAVALGWL